MRHATSDCQVLVVGAGPTGLVLAAELLARGISTLVVDKGDGIALQSRANGLHARSLEVLDTMGLANDFIRCGHVVGGFHWYSDGKDLGTLDLSQNGSRFGFLINIPQHKTEELLRQRVTELGGRIEHGLELIRLREDNAVVTATLQDRSGAECQIAGDL